MKTETQIVNAINTQKQLCQDEKLPKFAPSNGRCWSCGKNIYQDYEGSTGYDGTNHITGCPHCNRSYCD